MRNRLNALRKMCRKSRYLQVCHVLAWGNGMDGVCVKAERTIEDILGKHNRLGTGVRLSQPEEVPHKGVNLGCE